MLHINRLVEEVCKSYVDSRDPFNVHSKEAFEHWANLVAIIFDASLEHVTNHIAWTVDNIEKERWAQVVIEELTDSK